MENLMHADIFFFIASIGLVLFIIIALVVAWHVVTMLRDARKIIKRVQSSAERVGDTIETIASDVKDDGLVATIGGLFHREKKKKGHH